MAADDPDDDDGAGAAPGREREPDLVEDAPGTGHCGGHRHEQ